MEPAATVPGENAVRIGFADISHLKYHAGSVDNQPLGGAHSAACYLARALARRGHDIYLMTYASSSGDFEGVKCLSWDATPPSTLRSFQFDVFVCLHGIGTAVALRAALGPATRFALWTQHSFDQPAVQFLHSAEERRAFDDIVLVSDWQRTEFIRRFQLDPARTQVLRNAVAPAFENLFPDHTPILGEKARPPILAYTSAPFRGLDLLLEVFPAIRAATPDVRLRVFSSMSVYQTSRAEDEAKYGELYRRCRETAGVEYIGSLPQAALADEMRNVMALAYPNTFAETSCIAVMEAMASGCSVITTAMGALPETATGFARLVPLGFGRQRYLDQFVEQVTDALRTGLRNDTRAEAQLRRQIGSIRANATWDLRAMEWERWLQPLD